MLTQGVLGFAMLHPTYTNYTNPGGVGFRYAAPNLHQPTPTYFG
ncbi:hypothetical protein SPLC1_S030710 [Arthrospira platensis C1]|nr:hypothetical protein SPLC1_S030710 [Arthrospira platensis C1]